MIHSSNPIILFDSDCDVCTKIKHMIERIDTTSRIKFISIHDHEVYKKFKDINYWDCRKTIHIIDESNTIHTGEEAVIYLISFLKITKPASFIAKTWAGKVFIRQFYTLLNNYRLNNLKACQSCKI